MSIPFCIPSLLRCIFITFVFFPLELATHNNILLIINSALHDTTSVGWCLQMEDVKQTLEVLQMSVIQVLHSSQGSCPTWFSGVYHVLLLEARFELLTIQLDNPQSNQQPNASCCFWSSFFKLIFTYLFCCHPSCFVQGQLQHIFVK